MQYNEAVLRKLQAVELEMLLQVDAACKQLDIEYFLDSGTALGTARHQGFIPWDDDVDVGMLRSDYEKFLNEAQKLLPSNYKLCNHRNTKGYAPFFAKVIRTDTRFATKETINAGFDQGVFIDIFPYDALSMNKRMAQKQRFHCGMSQKLSYLYHSEDIVVPHKGPLGGIEKLACRIAHRVVSAVALPYKLALDYETWGRKGEEGPSGNVIIMAYPQMKAMPLETIFPLKTGLFEGHELPVPGKLDEYLTRMYGNWRQLPPVEDRRNHAPVELIFAD